jgi:lycopene beta-cyclase
VENPNNNQTDFDYIICGGGMSGLSLAYYFSISELSKKKILIIDPEKKSKNDRTWAFWENCTSPFEDIVHHSWNQVALVNNQGQKKIHPLNDYRYKIIRGIDFYEHIYKKLINFNNIKFEYSSVKNISETVDNVTVITKNNKSFNANFVFDSTHKLDLSNNNNLNLLQHFKGLVVETDTDFFNTDYPEIMNFSVPQINQECRFMYVIPFSKTKAIIEYTLFTENLLTEKEYDNQLNDFIDNNLKLKNYKILETEFGVIPMSNTAINEFPSDRVTRIGTAGGSTNAATGYTFANTQKRLQQIVNQLIKHNSPQIKDPFFNKRFSLYQSTLLHIIKNKSLPMHQVFNDLYTKNGFAATSKFLDNQTNFWEEIKIMWSTDIIKFGTAFFKVLIKKLFK